MILVDARALGTLVHLSRFFLRFQYFAQLALAIACARLDMDLVMPMSDSLGGI